MAFISGIISPFILVVVHATLGYSTLNPIIPLVGQGLAYSLFAAAFWPMAPMLIDGAYIGIAYGILFAAQSLSLAALPPLIAYLYTLSNDHYIPNIELFLCLIACLGCVCGLYVNYYDYTHGGVLNSVIKTHDDSNGNGNLSKDQVNGNSIGSIGNIGNRYSHDRMRSVSRNSRNSRNNGNNNGNIRHRQISNSSTVLSASSFY